MLKRPTKRTREHNCNKITPVNELYLSWYDSGVDSCWKKGEGTQYPKLQVWRQNSSQVEYYHKQGQDIQVDTDGTACETLTKHVTVAKSFSVD